MLFCSPYALDSGWKVVERSFGDQEFTQQGVTVIVNGIADIVMAEAMSYTISDVASAQLVGSVFTSGAEEILIDFGGEHYSEAGVSTIDLTGFGLEDTLVIAMHDGIVPISNVNNSAWSGAFEAKRGFKQTISSISGTDNVLWYKAFGSATLASRTNSGLILGSIPIIGLPEALPDSQFIFV
ncbi:MAG: hypothetical protein Q8N96_06880 [Methylovulum sp.]|nr:hypothetical protein [Methylovulum sp.]